MKSTRSQHVCNETRVSAGLLIHVRKQPPFVKTARLEVRA
jgi:hypothetical protein